MPSACAWAVGSADTSRLLQITPARFITNSANPGAVIRQTSGAAVQAASLNLSFRAQLVLPEQRQLYDYWVNRAAGRPMPERADIHPSHFPKLLPNISLVAVEDGCCRVRLAGTRLREAYDREITGLNVEDLDWGDKRDYWLASYRRAIEEGKPAQGVVRGPRTNKEHLVQYWLKLPLHRLSGGNVVMLLCLDLFQAASEEDEANARVYAG